MKIDYAFTCKFNPNVFTNAELETVLYPGYMDFIKRQSKYPVSFKYAVYELDSKGKLHVHAHIVTDKRQSYMDWNVKYFSVRVKPMSHKIGWYKYMNKDPLMILDLPIKKFARYQKHKYDDFCAYMIWIEKPTAIVYES